MAGELDSKPVSEFNADGVRRAVGARSGGPRQALPDRATNIQGRRIQYLRFDALDDSAGAADAFGACLSVDPDGEYGWLDLLADRINIADLYPASSEDRQVFSAVPAPVPLPAEATGYFAEVVYTSYPPWI